MAVVGNAQEMWEHRTTAYNGGIWRYTRGWLVKTDDKNDREDVVSTAPGLPAYGELHPAPIADPAYAREITYNPTSRGNTPMAWDVVATYSSERIMHDVPGVVPTEPPNVLDEVLVSWSSEVYDEAIWEDINGNGILNSAGDYFIDPTPTRDNSHIIARFDVNWVPPLPTWIIDYPNTVNDAAITVGGLTLATGTARFQRLQIGTYETRFGVTFYPVSFELHVHKDGWLLKPLDAGFRETSGGSPQQIKDANGDEPTTPVLLDGAGGVLANPSPATAQYQTFTVYESKDFSILPGVS